MVKSMSIYKILTYLWWTRQRKEKESNVSRQHFSHFVVGFFLSRLVSLSCRWLVHSEWLEDKSKGFYTPTMWRQVKKAHPQNHLSYPAMETYTLSETSS